MSHPHFKTVCGPCGTVINQCRCMTKDKTIKQGICESCELIDLESHENTKDWVTGIINDENVTIHHVSFEDSEPKSILIEYADNA